MDTVRGGEVYFPGLEPVPEDAAPGVLPPRGGGRKHKVPVS